MGALLDHMDADIGVGPVELRDQIPEETGSHQRRKPQGKGAAAVAVCPAHILHRLLIDVHQLLGSLQEPAALIREHLPTAEGVQQLHPQLLLQVLHRDGQGRLGDPQMLRRLGKASCLGHRHKICELLDIHDPLPLSPVRFLMKSIRGRAPVVKPAGWT